MKKKGIKRIILGLLLLIVVIGLYFLNRYLWREKYLFYATGTHEKAILNVTWEMSPQEVRRSIKGYLKGEKQNKTDIWMNPLDEPMLLNPYRFQTTVSGKYVLFGAYASIMFVFFDNKLYRLNILFDEMNGILFHEESDYQTVNSRIKRELSKKYGKGEKTGGFDEVVFYRWKSKKVVAEFSEKNGSSINIVYLPIDERIKIIAAKEQKSIF